MSMRAIFHTFLLGKVNEEGTASNPCILFLRAELVALPKWPCHPIQCPVLNYGFSYGSFHVPLCPCTARHNGVLNFGCVLAPGDPEKASISPETVPGICNFPILDTILYPPSDNLYRMSTKHL